MQTLEMIKQMIKQMYWADAKVWKRLFRITDLEKETELKKLCYHTHLTQHAFLKLWQNKPMHLPESDSFKSIYDIADWGFSFHQTAGIYIEGLEIADLSKEIVVPWTEGLEKRLGQKVKNATLYETIVQVFSHTTYHRGQVNRKIREMGSEPPLVDFIAWIWYGKPEAVWPKGK